jgi:hypothetical protein
VVTPRLAVRVGRSAALALALGLAVGLAVGLAALAAGCGTGEPPSSFGVNLTVSRARLDAAKRASIRTTRLVVPDDNDFVADIEASHFHGADEARFQYVPGVQSGVLRFFVISADATGDDVAAGASGPVALQPGGAVAARIELVGCTRAVAAGGPCAVDCECATAICVDGKCASSAKPLGASCVAGGECDSGTCLDGVCCGVTACPACRNCGPDGACSVTVTRAPDPSGTACDRGLACDAAGACKKANGQTCTANGECASNACIDGYCCDDPTCGGCRQCDAAGREGTCTNVPDGTDPRGACPAGLPRAAGGFFCKAGACATSCTCPSGTLCDNAAQNPTMGTPDCKKCHYCESGVCYGKVGAGTSCNYNVYCGSSSSCNMGLCGFTCMP